MSSAYARRTLMPTAYPAVIPMISYEDGIAAMEWLAKAFGFRERARQTGSDGKLSHRVAIQKP